MVSGSNSEIKADSICAFLREWCRYLRNNFYRASWRVRENLINGTADPGAVAWAQ